MAHVLNFPSYFNEEDDRLHQNMICHMLDDSLDSSVSTPRSSNESPASQTGLSDDDKRNKNKLAARKARDRKREDKAKIEENYKQLEEKNAKLTYKVKCLQLGIQECNSLIEKYTNQKTSVGLDQQMQLDGAYVIPQQKPTVFNIPDSDLFGFSEKTSVEATDEPKEVPKFLAEYKPLFSQQDELEDLDISCLDLDMEMDCINTSDLITAGSCDPIDLHNQINSDDIVNTAFNQVFSNHSNPADLNLDFLHDFGIDEIDDILRYQTS